LKKAAKSGVNVNVGVPAGVNKESVAEMSKYATVKTATNKSNARFCIVDNNEMLLFLTDDKKVHKSYDSAVWVEAPHFIDYFGSLFNKEMKQ